MSNEFFAPGDQRAARVGALFARIARHYDFLNDLQSFGLHRRWKQRVVEFAAIGPGEPALDVCCGTGDLAFALAARGAAVTGLDFSSEMLAVAAERNRRSTPPARVTFLQADAQQLPFAANSFAAVTVGYGLRNLPDWRAGLNEMARA